MPPDYNIYRGTDANRRTISNMADGRIGSTSDEDEVFIGSSKTPLGMPAVYPRLPLEGVDARRMWAVTGVAFGNKQTALGAAVQSDISGLTINPRSFTAAEVGTTDPVAMGYIMPNELIDGGYIEIISVGKYKPGSVFPRLLAKVKIGANYIAPQYETVDLNLLTVVDSTGTTPNCYEFSQRTLGLNALGGYEAANTFATNLPKGEFTWKMTTRIHSLGRYAKWSTGDDDTAADADGLFSANCWVECELEFGMLGLNSGGRIGNPPVGDLHTVGIGSLQLYGPMMVQEPIKGGVYEFMGRQWLCHAGGLDRSATPSWTGAVVDFAVWQSLLAEEAPGIGHYWREFFVPTVSKASISGFAAVDWSVGNELIFELGGAQHNLGVTPATWGAGLATRVPEGTASGLVTGSDGNFYACKTYLHYTLDKKLIQNVLVADFDPDPVVATDGIASERGWRLLPTNMTDVMRVQSTHAYLFGGRVGTSRKRLR
jgi:hypothetical protein